VDAIRHAGYLLTQLDTLEQATLTLRTHPLLGRASLHASLISGGSALSVYPESCVLRIERRTLPGESVADTLAEIREVCDRTSRRVSDFHATVETDFAQDPSEVSADAPVVATLSEAVRATGGDVRISGLSAWTDAALLNNAAIPAICYGPGDIALAHAAEEYVEVSEIEAAADVLTEHACRWLGSAQ
jgi:acetylornithine deacetylase